ncbi:MAG: SdrD B-like domain-containing protein, partial [Gammaproteobacteria bacterium]
NVPNAGAGGYSLTEQSQASAPLDAYLDGKLSTGSNCAGCTTTLTSPNAFNAILLDATKSYTGYNFAELAPGALSGHVYKDVDANAVQGGDEALAGITVSLTGTDDLGQAVNLTTTSAADGSYGFTKLRPSPAGYTLTETQPTSLADFAGASGTLVGKVGGVATGTAAANAASGIVLAPGQSGTGYDFRDKPASLAGRVYLDANDNAVVDGGEELIPGVTVKLTGVDADGGVVDMSTITVNGAWSFTGLKAGAYVLTETQPASHADGRESAGTAGGTVNNSEFNAAPQFNTIGAIVLAAGVDATGYAFGERPIPTSGAIGGSVFVDLNNDGRPGAGETGIANVTVRLSGRTARGELLAREIVTGKEGSWLFDNLEASDAEGYSVTEVQPADYLDGITSVGSAGGKAQGGKPVAAKGLDTIAGIVLGETVQAMGYHFGERSQGSVSGVVYFDQNGNGKQDAQESGIAAVSIALSGKDAKGAAVNLATTSGADGSFVFTSVPASDSAGYMLIEIQPSQHRDGATTIDAGSPGAAIGAKPVAAGGLDAISGIVVGAGKKLAGYRFGELGAGVQLGGRVYVQGTDTGIAGVTITLAGVDAGGATVSRSTSTDTEGRYLFDALAPSNAAGYRITEVQPAGVNDGPTVIPAGAPGKLDGAKPIGVGNSDSIAGVVMQEANRTGYDFIETAVPFLKPPVVNGYVWLDRTHDRVRPTDGSQQGLANWTVQLRQKGALICTTSTDAKGFYQFDNLHCAGYEASGLPTGSGFSVVFNKDGNRMPAVAVSGGGKGVAAPTGGQIDNLTLNPGDAVVEQNLPLDPAGVVYDAVTRKPVAGAVVTISGPAGFNVNTHLVGGTAAQAQTVGADGMYQFLLQNDFPSGVYALAVSVPAGYLPAPSSTIPPCVGTPKVGLVPTPALVQASDGAPALSVPLHKPGACVGMVAGGAPTTQYYQSFVITNGGSAPILNNHMPIDPIPVDGLVLAKTTPLVNVARGDLVPYTIVATNSRAQALPATVVQDMLPPGFQYKAGSARMNGAPAEPKLAGRTLSFAARGFAANEKATYTLILAVGAGVGDGEYVNRAVAVSPATGAPVSNTATAAVRIVPDATFDCPDVIGKVFDDANVNGVQDEGEAGLPGIRLATPRGLLITTDAQGRYHVPCAEIPNADRGANFVMKLDERTLPSGYRVTTENPGSVRITRGKLAKLNFGAAIHRVVRIEAGDTAFEPGSATLLPQWNQQLDTMIEQLKARPSVVRIALRQGADSALSARRMQALREAIAERWRRQGGAYALAVEEEGVQ